MITGMYVHGWPPGNGGSRQDQKKPKGQRESPEEQSSPWDHGGSGHGSIITHASTVQRPSKGRAYKPQGGQSMTRTRWASISPHTTPGPNSGLQHHNGATPSPPGPTILPPIPQGVLLPNNEPQYLICAESETRTTSNFSTAINLCVNHHRPRAPIKLR